MGWNKPSGEIEKHDTKSEKRSALRVFVLVGCLVVGIVALCVLFRPDGNQKAEKSPAKIGLIADVGTNVVARTPPKPLTDEEKRQEKLKWYYDRYGTNIPPNLKGEVYFLKHPPKRGFKTQNAKYGFLKHHSERLIASYGLAEPGTRAIMRPRLPPNFDADFMNALVDKIEVFDDDSDNVKQVKESVTALKKEIAQICREEGRTPSEILKQHADTMYDLGQYKFDLEQNVRMMRNDPSVSDADFEDCMAAANLMLKEKGLPEIKNNSLTSRAMRLQMIEKYRKLKEEKLSNEH